MTFLTLLFAHLLADYPLQGEFLANTKGKNIISLVSHAGIWTGTICVAAKLLEINIDLIDVFFLFSIHAIADFAKARPIGIYKRLNPLGLGLALDQMIHVLQIVVLLITR